MSLDLTGKKPGRGAYVCPSAACLAKARKARRIERALEVSIPDEIYAAMEAEIEKRGAECRINCCLRFPCAARQAPW